MRLAPSIALTALALSLATALPVSAQQLDAPIVRAVENSRASITLEVEAGSSGAPMGFRVEWIKQTDFNALGGWPADASTNPLVSRAQFYGTPTWNVSTGTYRLDPNEIVRVELGDLFDETGVIATNVNDLVDFQNYVFRVQATGTSSEAASNHSLDLTAATKPAAQNCTFTQGYWKTHPEAWPVNSLTLGTVNYTKAQLLLILGQPSKGNGLIILAHQLIAAKLNIASGADPTPVAATIAAADAQIGNLVVPPIGTGFLDPDDTAANAQILDSYNNGNLGVPHCGPVPATVQTWGKIRATYR